MIWFLFTLLCQLIQVLAQSPSTCNSVSVYEPVTVTVTSTIRSTITLRLSSAGSGSGYTATNASQSQAVTTNLTLTMNSLPGNLTNDTQGTRHCYATQGVVRVSSRAPWLAVGLHSHCRHRTSNFSRHAHTGLSTGCSTEIISTGVSSGLIATSNASATTLPWTQPKLSPAATIVTPLGSVSQANGMRMKNMFLRLLVLLQILVTCMRS